MTRLTQHGRNLHHQMQEDTHSHHPSPGQYGPDPWGNTRYLRNLVQWFGGDHSHLQRRRGRGRRVLGPIPPVYTSVKSSLSDPSVTFPLLTLFLQGGHLGKDTYHTMPMQLPNSALLQMLLSGCNIMASRQIIINLFAHPASRINSSFGVSKAPFQVGNGA